MYPLYAHECIPAALTAIQIIVDLRCVIAAVAVSFSQRYYAHGCRCTIIHEGACAVIYLCCNLALCSIAQIRTAVSGTHIYARGCMSPKRAQKRHPRGCLFYGFSASCREAGRARYGLRPHIQSPASHTEAHPEEMPAGWNTCSPFPWQWP